MSEEGHEEKGCMHLCVCMYVSVTPLDTSVG